MNETLADLCARLADEAVLVSGSLGEPSGLIGIDRAGIQRIDFRLTTGLHVTGDGRLLRLTRDQSHRDANELLAYDEHGLRTYARLDKVLQAHDALLHDGQIVVVSTGSNEITTLTADGSVLRSWSPGRSGSDSWHLNCLVEHQGRLFVSAFGEFDDAFQWHRHADEATGVLIDVERGDVVLRGLEKPHTPRHIDGRWVVCNSGAGELVRFDADGVGIDRRLKLEGYPRGLLALDDLLLVGESGHRYASDADAKREASIAVVDRSSWELVGRFDLGCAEVYDIVLAPERLADGVLRNEHRSGVSKRAWEALLAQSDLNEAGTLLDGAPLLPEECSVRIEAHMPERVPSGSQLDVPTRIHNLGARALASIAPHPVHLSARWRLPDESGDEMLVREAREPQPRATLGAFVPAGGVATRMLRVLTPSAPGTYRLDITLVQEEVIWFDAVDAANAISFVVHVDEPVPVGVTR